MAKKADTWMPWYVGDYMADTTNLNTEQHGAYCLMLMAAWKRGGSLPKDDGQLASITKLPPARFKAHRAILLECFQDAGDSYRHKRVAEEHAKAKLNSEKKALNGAKGGKAKQQNASKPLANATANDEAEDRQTSTPSPSPSPPPTGDSVSNETGGEPPGEKMTAAETIFHYGVPMLTNAGIAEARARSFLGGLRKGHGDDAVIAKMRECFKAKPLQPLEWLAAALPPKDIPEKLEWHETQSGIEAMGIKLGIGLWTQTEQFPVYKARVIAAHTGATA